MRPNLFLVGAAKCGTSTVYDYFMEHPDIFCCDLKEPRYFSHPHFCRLGAHQELLDRAVKTEAAYLKLYSRHSGQPYAADGSAYSLFFPGIARQIHDFSADAKIVICLRNPADRFISHYNMHLRDTGDTVTLADFLKHPYSREKVNLLDVGRYSRQVEEYLSVFGREHVHIIIFDDLVRDFTAVTERLCRFLQIRPFEAPVRRLNISGKPRSRLYGYFNRFVVRTFPPSLKKHLPLRWTTAIKARLDRAFLEKAAVSAADRAYLQNEYQEDMIRLEKLLDMDLNVWRQNRTAGPEAEPEEKTQNGMSGHE